MLGLCIHALASCVLEECVLVHLDTVYYLKIRVFLLRKYGLMVSPWEFNVLKTNMLILRTSKIS